MEKILVFLSMLFLSGALALWLVKPRTAAVRNAQQIRDSLLRLLKRPYGAHVIVEEPSFGKYIQFSGSTREPLIFDLPRQYLTLDEFDRACHLFAELGLPGPETFAIFDTVGSSAICTQTSFILVVGEDIEQATQLALMVFAAVYGIGDRVALKVSEH